MKSTATLSPNKINKSLLKIVRQAGTAGASAIDSLIRAVMLYMNILFWKWGVIPAAYTVVRADCALCGGVVGLFYVIVRG